MTNNILFGQSELEDFTKSETERRKLNKKELREYVSYLENISDSLLRKKNDNIVGLQSQLKEKKIRIFSIENEIVKLKTLQSQLESEKSDLESEKTKLESEKSGLESEKTKLESEKSDLENKLEKLSILVSENNEELNLLRKLNGIENDTSTNHQNIKEIGDGSVISVGELTLSPNGYKYQNKPYTGYLWNLKEGNYIFDCHQSTSDRDDGSEYSDLYFGMVKDGIKDGIWVENKKYSDNIVVISKYDEGKIYNGFTLEIDWDISYYLIKNKLRLNNFFDSLPDDFQFIEITENVEEQTDNITKNFKYEGNKTYVEHKKMELYFKSLNPQERIEFTKRLYKVLCEELNKIENLTDLLIILNDFTKNKFVTGDRNYGDFGNSEGIGFKFDNYDLGMKNGLSIDSKLKCMGPISNHPSSKDVNQKESWTYDWDVDVSHYKNGELHGNSIKGKYTYRKDGTNRGVIEYPQFVDKKRYWTPLRNGKTENLLKYLRKERRGVSNITRTFEETKPNKTDIIFFTSKPDFISISETDEYELENYKQGKKDGVQTYYEKGVLTLKEKYSEGELNGDKEVYKTGIIQSVETFSNGLIVLKKIYENGIIKEEHYCRGEKSKYGNKGKFILKRVIYLNGNLKETWYYKSDVRLSDYNIQDKENTYKITKH